MARRAVAPRRRRPTAPAAAPAAATAAATTSAATATVAAENSSTARMNPTGTKLGRRRRGARGAGIVAARKAMSAAAKATKEETATAVAADPPAGPPAARNRPRDRPPRLRFPLLLLLLVGPAAGAPARTLISVDSPAGLPNGCENPITGEPMPQNAEWPDTGACRVLLCKLEMGKPIVEVVGCTPHVVSPGCSFVPADGESKTAFPNCCGRYVCQQGGLVGYRSGLDKLIVYAV